MARLLRRTLRRLWPHSFLFTQNLARERDERTCWGSMPYLVNTRWHFYPYGTDHGAGWSTSGQLTIPSRFTMALFTTDVEDGLGLHLACPLAALWVHLRPRTWGYRVRERSWGLRVFSGAIWWSIGESEHEWHATDPWWRHGSWQVVDTLLGAYRHGVVRGEPQVGLVPLPEGLYRVVFTRETRTWTRPRWPHWPCTKVRRTWEATAEEGLPIPGKGENSYDLAEDALFATNVDAGELGEAIGRLVGQVLRTRARRAGLDWVPAALRGPTPDDQTP